MFFRSKLYREEIKHWWLLTALFIWAVLATITAIKPNKTLLLALDESGTRLITDSQDKFIRLELKNFITQFLNNYYTFNELTFQSQISNATDLMSKDLWDREKEKLAQLNEKLKADPISQFVQILSIDQIDESNFEITSSITLNSRMSSKIIKIKTKLQVSKIKRSESNPWGFEVTELTDVVL